MKLKVSMALVLLLGTFLLAPAPGWLAASGTTPTEEELCLIDFKRIPRLTIDELKSRLGDPALVVIDVRSSADWNGSSIKIKGAVREVYANAAKWASKYDKDKTIVLYCA